MKQRYNVMRFLQSMIPAVLIAAGLSFSADPGYAELVLPTSTGKMTRAQSGYERRRSDESCISYHLQ